MKLSLFINGLILALWSVLFSGITVWGQTETYYSKAENQINGYWYLKTDMAIHGTLIRFYSADSQLVYQESLPNRFIELNPKNIRQLDQALARLLNNQLVASSVSTSKLPFFDLKSTNRRKGAQSTNTDSESESKSAEMTFQVRLFSPSTKKTVHAVIENPTLERLTLSVLSADNTGVYEHITHLAESRHHLNFEGMPAGTYQIRVKSATRQYQQAVMLTYGKHEATLQLYEKESLPTSVPKSFIVLK